MMVVYGARHPVVSFIGQLRVYDPTTRDHPCMYRMMTLRISSLMFPPRLHIETAHSELVDIVSRLLASQLRRLLAEDVAGLLVG